MSNSTEAAKHEGTSKPSAKPKEADDRNLFRELTVDEALARLKATPGGLSSREASRRLAEKGPNRITENKTSLWLHFIGYFWGPIPWMIEIAAALSAVARDWTSFGVIFAMLLINGGIGFWQEKSAADALEALKRQLALKATARRDGKWQEIDATQLVPGDIIRLRLGDVVPADVKLMGDNR